MAAHLYTFDDPPNERHLQQAVDVLIDGGVICYPTEGLWAFGCDPRSRKAMDRISRLKPQHPKAQPFSMLCSSISMASKIGLVSPHAYRALKKAWPGPYTILLSSTRELPRQLRDKRRVVGIRVPAVAMLRALVEAFGRPIATTSVPFVPSPGSGTAGPAKFGYEILEAFGHGIDLVLDLGEAVPAIPSTIVDMSGEDVVLVREGLGDISALGIFV